MTDNTPAYKKSSFGPAFFFLGKRRKEALANYYEFCRKMDDIVDEPHVKNPSGELDFWQEEIGRIYTDMPKTHLGKQLQRDVAFFDITQDRFSLLVEGMRADLKGRHYATLEELEWYLYRVAVVVGLATLDILGVKGPQADSLAKHLGGAVQLTNIIRDVSSDVSLNRVYLPTRMLEEEGISRQEVLEGSKPEELSRVLKKLDGVACRLYAKAFEEMKKLPRLKMLPCRLMGYVYFANLAKIKKTGFYFTRPVKLSKPEKITEVFHALVKTVFP